MRNNSSDTPTADSGGDQEITATLKISKRWLELAVYALLLVTTAFYAMEALNLPNYGASSNVGANGFPLLVALFIAVSLGLLIAANVLKKSSQDGETFVEVGRPLQVLLTVVVMTAVVLTLEWVGLIIGITLLAFLLMKLGGENRYLLLLTLPPLLALGIYVIFVLVLGVYFD